MGHVSDLPEGQRGKALKDSVCPLPMVMLGQVLELGWGILESTEQLGRRHTHTCRSNTRDLRQENEEELRLASAIKSNHELDGC